MPTKIEEPYVLMQADDVRRQVRAPGVGPFLLVHNDRTGVVYGVKLDDRAKVATRVRLTKTGFVASAEPTLEGMRAGMSFKVLYRGRYKNAAGTPVVTTMVGDPVRGRAMTATVLAMAKSVKAGRGAGAAEILAAVARGTGPMALGAMTLLSDSHATGPRSAKARAAVTRFERAVDEGGSLTAQVEIITRYMASRRG